MSITYNISHSFDGMKTRAKFLDISKVLTQAWHKRRIYKGLIYGFTEKACESSMFVKENTDRNKKKWI